MPSQRLLKILDPLGHVRDLAAPLGITAVAWTPAPSLLTLVKNRLAAAGVHALIATSFRHVASSVTPGARPLADLAIVDFDGCHLATCQRLRRCDGVDSTDR
jgi:hypothetical protein